MNLLKLILPFLVSLSLLLYVIFFVQPPTSWINASNAQILSFFIPLLATFTFLVNIYLKYLPHSFAVGIGLMLLVLMKALSLLEPLTVILVILLTALILRLIPKPKPKKETEIRKISISKPEKSLKARKKLRRMEINSD